jgi:hypothetical protein
VTLVAFAPWYVFAVKYQLAFVNHYPPVEGLTLERLSRLMATLLAAEPRAGVPSGDPALDWLLTVAVVILAAVGALRIFRVRPESGLALVGFSVTLIPIVWWMDTRSQYFISERQFIFLVPLLYVMAGSGIDGILTRLGGWLDGRRVAFHDLVAPAASVALASILLLASIAPLHRVYHREFRPKEDWRAASVFAASVICPDGDVYSNVPASYYYGVTLYAPELAGRATYLHENSPDEFVLDVIHRYPITSHDVIVIFTGRSGVFVPGRGGIDLISTTLGAQGFDHKSFTNDRIRVMFPADGCGA